MKFIDAKEQIIDIQMTSWGKYLLSLGKLKPVYYSFTDADVLYDGKFADIVETQNDIVDRIKDNTPRLEAMPQFVGIESNISRTMNDKTRDVDATAFKNEEKQSYNCVSVLGNCGQMSEEAPAWEISFKKGEVGGHSIYLSGSEGMQAKVPQLNMKDLQYVVRVGNINDESIEDRDSVETWQDNRIYEDGTYLYVVGDEIRLTVKELNGEFTNANFDVEFFEVVSGSGGTDRLIPLFFAGDDLGSTNIDKNHVEYFFDISFDKDIHDQRQSEIGRDIYTSRVTEDEVNNKC